VHGVCGLVGILGVATFHKTEGMVFGRYSLAWANLVGCLIMSLFNVIVAYIVFKIISILDNYRVRKDLRGTSDSTNIVSYSTQNMIS